jgi:hypothetical protein
MVAMRVTGCCRKLLVVFEVDGYYGMSLVAIDVNGCHGKLMVALKYMVAMESKWLL